MAIAHLFRWSCDECNAHGDCTTEQVASVALASHRRVHQASAVIGQALEGRVFDVDAEGQPYLGVIGKAEMAARNAGCGFFTWNGDVHPTIGWDLNRPLCEARHVPGTAEQRRHDTTTIEAPA